MRKTVHFLSVVVILFIILITVSCGKEEVIKPVSEESKLTLEAFALSETIKNAYTESNIIALQKNSTEEGYNYITANKKSFDSVELTFTPRWAEIEDTKIYLNIAWKSRWIIPGGIAEDRGMAVFIMEGKPLKLTKILRANPFVCPDY